MKLKSTLRIFNEAEVPWGAGIVEGQSFKRIAGGENTRRKELWSAWPFLTSVRWNTSIGI